MRKFLHTYFEQFAIAYRKSSKRKDYLSHVFYDLSIFDLDSSASLRLLQLLVLISMCNPLLAYKPQQYSDYQRKDLANAGIIKVIYKYELLISPKGRDTFSIRQYDRNGFLTILDSFSLGKDSLYHRFLSRRVTYLMGTNSNTVRIEETQKPGSVAFQTILVQTFDKAERLVNESLIIDNDTTQFTYKYDFAGQCVEKIGRSDRRNKTITNKYIYKYDKKLNVNKEEWWIDSALAWSSSNRYDSSGLLIERQSLNGVLEKYNYTNINLVARYERVCSSDVDPRTNGNETGAIFTYSYDEMGRLSELNCKLIDCRVFPSTKFEYKETLTYLHSGLLDSRCGWAGCYQFIYLKNK